MKNLLYIVNFNNAFVALIKNIDRSLMKATVQLNDVSYQVFSEQKVFFKNDKNVSYPITSAKILNKVDVVDKYVLSNNNLASKLKNEISEDVYATLSPKFMSMYKKVTSNAIEVTDLKILTLANIDSDYEPNAYLSIKPYEITEHTTFYGDKTTQLLPYILSPYKVGFDASVGYYLPHVFSGERAMQYIKAYIEDKWTDYYSSYYSSWKKELSIKIWEHKYNGEMKKQEVKNARGGSYAKPRYRSIRAYPDVAKTYEISGKDISIKGANVERTIMLINKFADNFFD